MVGECVIINQPKNDFWSPILLVYELPRNYPSNWCSVANQSSKLETFISYFGEDPCVSKSWAASNPFMNDLKKNDLLIIFFVKPGFNELF